ncbi:MAG: hypothetical protein IPF63_12925 [Bacteroidetes bacterium]|nr:hypothetical protein [Bacteroidota bacterium]
MCPFIGILLLRTSNTDKLADYIIVGELSLDGILQPIKGALPTAIQAKKMD